MGLNFFRELGAEKCVCVASFGFLWYGCLKWYLLLLVRVDCEGWMPREI